MSILGIDSTLPTADIKGTTNMSDPTEEEETPSAEVMDCLKTFVEAIRHTNFGYYNTIVPQFVVDKIRKAIHGNSTLLKVGYDDCDTLWRWLVKNDHYNICLLIFKNWDIGCDIPINAVDPVTGDSVLTDHRFTLSPEMFDLLITNDERMDFYNTMTRENLLHVLVKKRPGNLENKQAYNLLGFLVKKCETMSTPFLEYIPDIDLVNHQGKSPLQIALESEWMEMAKLLVKKLGADFNCVTYSSLPRKSKEYIEKCRSLHTIKSNVFEIDDSDKECSFCTEDMEPGKAYRMVTCCNKMVHSECLRKYLTRTKNPKCILCNSSNFEKEVLAAIPNTVFKSKWPRVRDADFQEGIIGSLLEVLQRHIPSIQYENNHSQLQRSRFHSHLSQDQRVPEPFGQWTVRVEIPDSSSITISSLPNKG